MAEKEGSSSFQYLAERLSAASVEAGPAMAHGVFCGLICGGSGAAEAVWIAEFVPGDSDADLPAREVRVALLDLAAHTRAQLSDSGLGIRPLLPDDDMPLDDRVLALGEWCEGFLFGVGLAGPDLDRLSDEAREALRDLTSVSHVDHGGEASGGADEESFAEVAEFIWVAAMLIHSDLARDPDNAR